MRSAGLCVLLLLAACAPEGSTLGVTDPTRAPVTLESWCAAQTAGRCLEGFVFLDGDPARLDCVVGAPDDQAIADLCAGGESDPLEPVTTIPAPDQEEGLDRAELEQRLWLQDRRAVDLLSQTHPDDAIDAGVILVEAVELGEAERLVARSGGTLIAAWRTDYVCLPGWEGMPFETASRFAYLDGVERADRLRREMENSTTPVTGAHIPLNAFAIMEQEAVALREPGVLLEALQVSIPAASLGRFDEDDRVARVRIVDFPVDGIDLGEIAVPNCDDAS